MEVKYVPINTLLPAKYNPRRWDETAADQLKGSMKKFGVIDPLIVNFAPARRNVIIGGHFRWVVAKKMRIKEMPVVYVNIPDLEREKELNLRLNRNTGEWNWDLLAECDEALLAGVGFTSEEIDEVFGQDENPEVFDLEKELKKLDITKVSIKKSEVYKLGEHRMMCGDSTIEADVFRLTCGESSKLCLSSPPYSLS